jgi:hypothetical protein
MTDKPERMSAELYQACLADEQAGTLYMSGSKEAYVFWNALKAERQALTAAEQEIARLKATIERVEGLEPLTLFKGDVVLYLDVILWDELKQVLKGEDES